jgi:hypothetical protein
MNMTHNNKTNGRGQINEEQQATANTVTTPCVPIGAVLAALNWTHVNLVALDTETTESHIIVRIVLRRDVIGVGRE